MTRCVALLIGIAAWLARAHDADVIYVLAQSTGEAGEVMEVMTLTGAALGQLAPVDADGDGVLSAADLTARSAAIEAGVWDEAPLVAGGRPCAREATGAKLKEGYVELTARFRCGEGELRQDFKILRVLPANFRVVLGSQMEGEAGKAFAQGRVTALTVPRPPPAGAFSRARFENGVAGGVAAMGWAGTWAALVLALGGAGAWRRGLEAWCACAVGLAVGAFVSTPEWIPLAVVAAAAVPMAAVGRTNRVVAALVGVSLTARAGGGPWSFSLGLGLGAVGASVVVGPALVAIGRLVQRRPTVWRGLRWAAAAAVWLAVGFRLAA
jgi:hypothetical protein